MRRIFSFLAACLLLISCDHPGRAPCLISLDNGVRILIEERRADDIIALQVLLGESGEKAGITALTARIWPKGTGTFTSREISTLFDSLGARFGVSVQPDFTAFSLKTTSSSFEEAFRLFYHVLTSPSFPEEEFLREKNQLLSEIRRTQDDLFGYSYELLRNAVYGDHPYGYPSLGSEDSVRGLEREDVISLFDKMLTGGNTVVSASGNFRSADMALLLTEKFSNLPPGQAPTPENTVIIFEGGKVIRKNMDINSAWIMIGFPAPPVLSEDYEAVKVLNAALGAGMSSRLFVRIRERAGLAYSVGSFYPTRRDTSHICVYAIVEPELADAAVEAILSELKAAAEDVFSEDEVGRAVNFLSGQHMLGQELLSDRAWNLAFFEMLGAGWAYADGYVSALRKIDSDSVTAAASAYLREPVIVIVGPGVENHD